MEMISALVYQLTQNLCVDDIKKSGFDAYFVDQSTGNLPLKDKTSNYPITFFIQIKI